MMVIDSIKETERGIRVDFETKEVLMTGDFINDLVPKYLTIIIKGEVLSEYDFLKDYINNRLRHYKKDQLSSLYQNEFNIKKFIKDYNIKFL